MRLAEAVGWRADWSEVAPVGPHTLADARVVVLWRVTWSPHVQGIVEACAEIGARVVFDVDDLMFKPELARVQVIDGIRSAGHTESGTWTFFELIRRALDACALCICPTEELADHVRDIGRAAFVLPNGFDQASHARARQAARAARIGDQDGLVRIGYAAGSRTHQRDFAVVVGAVARVLRERSHARLSLFRDPNGGEGVVLLNEFPILAGLESQIEWRDMVSLERLPDELARFDINLAPLEIGNEFCEAKSELKYFEAALADVPTVASPTGPMRRAIRDGETGFLAETEDQWHDAILTLVDDPARRRLVGRTAYHDVLWRYGPARREELMLGLLRQIEGGREGARAFELELRRQSGPRCPSPIVPESEELFAADALGTAEVTVIVPIYNYEGVVLEALESVRLQTLEPLDLVAIDDGSTDDSAGLVLEWARRHAGRFNRLVVRRHLENAGLGFARNSGFAAAETPFVLPLDADNRLRPACCATLLEQLRACRAAFAYPTLQQFGDKGAVFSDEPYLPGRLVTGNYIDAMALIAKWAWAAAGGYDHVRFGWEDYDFWCRLVELGLWGEHIPEVLAEYRVHKASMLASSTNKHGNKRQLIADMHRRHPWLRIATPG
jgi:glycosyltransferase involved in cell wall biosynthesis